MWRGWCCDETDKAESHRDRRPEPQGEGRRHDHFAQDRRRWKVDRNGALPGLHKTHALQGPIDDAFLDPFLLVRPTGTPWNEAVNAAGAAHAGALRPAVGQVFPRPSFCEGR